MVEYHVGQKFYKEKLTEQEYIDIRNWCDNNNCTESSTLVDKEIVLFILNKFTPDPQIILLSLTFK